MSAPKAAPEHVKLAVVKGYICTALADGTVPLNSRCIAKVDSGAETIAEWICRTFNLAADEQTATKEHAAAERARFLGQKTCPNCGRDLQPVALCADVWGCAPCRETWHLPPPDRTGEGEIAP